MAPRTEPHDRLTQIANDLGRGLRDHPLYHEGDRVIICVDDGSKGGIGVMDYDEPKDAIVDLLGHLRALCRAYGIHVDLLPLPNNPHTS